MPLPRMQTMLLLLSMLTVLLLLCYLSFTTFAPSQSHGQATSSFLFPASAVISLTDDNSTFFISRPAAFGPSLPKNGMDGELFVLEEGQLACDDTPGWDPSAALDIGVPLFLEGAEDDGTDNILNPTVPNAMVKTSYHADIESLQQSAEIEGKIVLVARGGCGFLEKVLWTQRRGGVALIVGDYKRPGIGGGSSGLVTMYAKGKASSETALFLEEGSTEQVSIESPGDTSNVSIPSLFTSHTTAALLTTLLPKLQRPTSAAFPPSPKSSSLKPSPTRIREPPNRAQLPKLSDGHPQTTPTLSASAVPTKFPAKPPLATERKGLWITLTPTTMTSSPFFDTLLVLVVSPLVTLTVVYTLLLIRSRIRRRRWRAPKSLVERLPVRTYQSTASTPPTPPSTTFPPPRSSSLPTASHNITSGENPASTSTANALPSPPQRQNTASTHAVAGKAFHRRWSGCNECVVCLEEYVDGVSRVMKLPCGHEFHAGCITPWLTTRRRTCPICKGDVVRGVRAIMEPSETAGDGADETTPLVLGVDDEEHWGHHGDLEGGSGATTSR
ncbi:hypothetical protein BDD12DRAFT_889866 [Trichophaea hybrida]|nr:hypothetical protein BDD12DRAFT_889866 [Trichophaea hybrida]